MRWNSEHGGSEHGGDSVDLLTSLRMSWRSLRDHKLRSVLTTLGVIIGVAAVITFVTLGASLQADIVRSLAGENTDVMFVTASSEEEATIPGLNGAPRPVFTEHDVRLLQTVDGVQDVIPESGIAVSQIEHANDSVGRQLVTATSPGYFDAREQNIVDGRTFEYGEEEVVINERAAGMFSDDIEVGDEINMTRAAGGEEMNATVVGIVREHPPDEEREGEFPLLGQGEQPSIYAPTDPYYERRTVSPNTETDQRVFPRLLVVVHEPENVEAVRGAVQTRLAEDSDASILMPEDDHFQVTTHQEMVDRIEQISQTFTAYIAGIAVISLIVGAIGIANIMLANVAERRREIGIMKAIGGQNRDVLQLFLNEAVMLGVLGSVVGAVVGLLGAWIATELIGLPLVIEPTWFVVAIVVGVGVGVISGIYPAWSAARTDPIDALRHE